MDIGRIIDLNKHNSEYTNGSLDEGLQIYQKRMQHNRDGAQGRMIRNKAKVLKDVINNSYYGANVAVMNKDKRCRVAIYPKRDGYEDISTEKIVYAEFIDGLDVGDVLYWRTTNSYWLIYQQNESELAFFEGNAMQCSNYMISNLEQTIETYAAFSIKAADQSRLFDETLVSIDNTILEVRIPDTQVNRKYFSIGQKFMVDETFWRIKSINWLTMKGIITITAIKDIEISDENLIKIQEKAAEPIIDVDEIIIGPNKIKPKQLVVYELNASVVDYDPSLWSVSVDKNIEYTIKDDKKIEILWTNIRKTEDFAIYYGNAVKEIKVESFM